MDTSRIRTALQSPALYEAIADHLRERILMHELPAGSAIDEAGLAAFYGVSRTPLREALKVLVHEGLLNSHLRRGTSVTRLDAEERQEAVELHTLLLQRQQQQQQQQQQQLRDGQISDRLLRQLLLITERRLRLAQGPPAQPQTQAQAQR